MVSTRNLTLLPDPDGLRLLCQSLAMLDAMLQPEWDLRWHSFNSRWTDGEMMASIKDGSGDDYFLLFSSVGTILKGYAHESPFADHFVRTGKPWPGVLDQVPPEFAGFSDEPAFSPKEATFCLWRTPTDIDWRTGNIRFPAGDDPDGSEDLLTLLDGRPTTYRTWAEEYFERPVPLSGIEQIYRHQPLTAEMVGGLSPDITLLGLKADLEEIGYPLA